MPQGRRLPQPVRYSNSLSFPRNRREIWLSLAAFAVLVAALQWYRGAFHAEFTGQADEAAHFVTSLMVRDYLGTLSTWPPPSPMPWAVNYYLHYPKVALGHWPPGYYIMQAVWWLFLPPGRFSAMLLNTAMAAAAAGLLLTMARRIRGGWPAWVICVVMLAAPVTQQAICETMSDLPSLLFSILVMYFLARLVQEPGARPILYVAGALLWSILVKGTGVTLVLAPVLAAGATGFWRRLNWRWLAVPALAGTGAVAWFCYQHFALNRDVLQWGGIGNHMVWKHELALYLAGPGLAVTALCGALTTVHTRRPETIAAAAIAASMLLSALLIGAMRELRHWIGLLPAILLLTLAFYSWLEERGKLAPLAALAAMCFFPFEISQAQFAGFAQLAKQVKHPARMLISSSVGWPEGSWIAEVALLESRPGSTIVRASKLFADAGWNDTHYRLRIKTPEEMERAVEEAGIETVILHSPAVAHPVEHHPLLIGTLRDNPRWRTCGNAGQLTAYCRASAPRYPRKPLRIDLRDRMGAVIEEKLDP